MELITNIQSPEFRFRIALQTPIPNLPSLCAQSKVWREVCDSEDFWRLRFNQDFPTRFLLKDNTYKESYQYWYRISLKLRPFGYYPDDQEIIGKFRKFRPNQNALSLDSYFIHPDNQRDDDILLPLIKSYVGPYTRQAYDILDMIIRKNIDQFKFISEVFVILNINRIEITLPESIDLLFYATGKFRYYERNGKYSVQKAVSLLSSLNYNQLKDYLGNVYDGFPDYPSMFNAAITGDRFTTISMIISLVEQGQFRHNIIATPRDFNHQRYKYVKQLDLIKILWLQRVYLKSDVEGFHFTTEYPPYLFVTCFNLSTQLEDLYQKVSPNNYITILDSIHIRTDDNPNYNQALGRMTLIHNLNWVIYYMKTIDSLLGLSYEMADDLYAKKQSNIITLEEYVEIVRLYLQN